MGTCQNIYEFEKEISFNTPIIKQNLSYQKLNHSIIIEYSYSKYHHPFPLIINQSIKKPSKYYKNDCPPKSLKNKEKFTDKLFPPNIHSLTYISEYNKEFVESSEITQFKNFSWKRISEIFTENKYDLFNTLDVDDIQQGIIGNCYFLCVLSSLAKRPEIYDKIFIDKKIKENGMYKLRFIINGIPQIIIVDDYFPTFDNKFIFAQSKNEFWVQLLEKAWAKINLSYANTIAGIPYEVFNCLSEAPCENISHQRNDVYFVWNELIRAKREGFYITCNTKYLSKEQEDNEGLISGHSYAILDLFEFNIFYKKGTISESDYENNIFNCNLSKKEEDSSNNNDNKILRILKIYNPWAWFEWKGKFNDNDDESWNKIPKLKELVGYNNNEDGIFFMELSDYYKKFHSTYILNYLKDWVYNYKMINQKSNDYFSCVKLILKKENKIRFGLHVKQSRINLMEKNSLLYPATLIVLKYNSELNKYTLISSVYDITDNIFSKCHKIFEPGEYHILMHYNADKNKVSDYNYTLSTYSQEKVELLDFKENDEIPNNYLNQIINDYIQVNNKTFDETNKDINYYFDNSDNDLGMYFFSIINKSKVYYFIELEFYCVNCELIQDELVENYFYNNDIIRNKANISKYFNEFKKLKKIKQIIKYLLKPGENKLFIWKLKNNIRNCSLKLVNNKFYIFDKKTMIDINICYYENLYKYEMIRNIFHDLDKKELNEDLKYSEIENNEYIFIIIKNDNKNKTYIFEFSFIKLIGLKLELMNVNNNNDINMDEDIYNIIFYPGRIYIMNLKKDKTATNFTYDFTVNYQIVPI